MNNKDQFHFSQYKELLYHTIKYECIAQNTPLFQNQGLLYLMTSSEPFFIGFSVRCQFNIYS